MIIVDGTHLLHRCRYNAPEIDWKGYCRTFCNLFLAILRTLPKQRVILCWNFKGSYKKRRVVDIENGDVKKEFLLARKWLHGSMPQLGFCSILMEGVETGEIAHWLINRKITELDCDINYLVSADKTWVQLITPRWHIYNPLIGETVTYYDFCKKYRSKPYYIVRQALLGTLAIDKCYGISERNVDRHVENILSGKDLLSSETESINVHNFVADNRLTENIKLLELGLLARGERRKLHIKYEESISRAEQPSLHDKLRLAREINAPCLLIDGTL